MKTSHYLAIMATLLSVNVRAAEQKKAVPGATVQSKSYFYTGKPYDKDLGEYVFAYRSYSPTLSRWTSADPSGYPDGANNRVYAPVPSSQIDPNGLLTISVTAPDPPNDDVTLGGKNFVVTANTIAHINPVAPSFNGWNITAGANIAGSFNVHAYGALSNNPNGSDPYDLGVQLNITSVTGLPTLAAGHTYGWLQVITSNDLDTPGTSQTIIDNNKSKTNPLYNVAFSAAGGGQNPYFADWSCRDASDTSIVGGTINWQASLYLVDVSGTNITVHDGFSWGWSIE